ncbi:hypothetical protein BYT27DRAFT_6375516 [Phlegmacium glaucopus]|nr:hypothetical protein BYT27DRAFT_6375516 [Phlegmacium glaucopus]
MKSSKYCVTSPGFKSNYNQSPTVSFQTLLHITLIDMQHNSESPESPVPPPNMPINVNDSSSMTFEALEALARTLCADINNHPRRDQILSALDQELTDIFGQVNNASVDPITYSILLEKDNPHSNTTADELYQMLRARGHFHDEAPVYASDNNTDFGSGTFPTLPEMSNFDEGLVYASDNNTDLEVFYGVPVYLYDNCTDVNMETGSSQAGASGR